MTVTVDRREKTFFGQPRALANLFGVEDNQVCPGPFPNHAAIG